MSKKDDAWEAIFHDLRIEEQLDNHGYASISADKIKEVTRDNEVGQQEPRIITKFDAREHRARILRHHNCTILATSNGQYSIFKGDGYHDIEDTINTQTFGSKNIESLETLPPICTSESQVIDTAKASGLLENFLEDKNLELTIRGRLRSGSFDFNFDKHPVNVNGVQIEVDAGYEGNRIYLIEAKMGTRDNFITRQLYYPYRMWNARDIDKNIIPVFVSYSDKTFHIHQYSFTDKDQYNSIELVKSGSFVLEAPGIISVADDLNNFKEMAFLKVTPANPRENETPFPQADDIRKVIDAIFAVANGYKTKEEISYYYDFDERQSYYYGNAAKYLGFLDLNHGSFVLTEEGRQYIDASKDERKLIMIRAMMGSPTINALFKETVDIGAIPDTKYIANTIQENRPEVNDTTAKRRAHTMEKWLEWILRQTSHQLRQAT